MWLSSVLATALVFAFVKGSEAAPSQLRTHLHLPGAIALACPFEAQSIRLSWTNQAPDSTWTNMTQISFEIQVFSGSSIIFQTGVVESDEQEAFLNVSLDPESQYSWRVRTTLAKSGTPLPVSPWSSLLEFETAPTQSSWGTRGALWIGGHGQLRADFVTHSSPILRARVYVAGLGAFYLFINGKKVGNHVMDPPQTVYPSRILFSTFDVTSFLSPGFNVVGAMLGNYKWGYTDIWCNMTTARGPDGCRCLILQLVVEHADGSSSVLVTDTGNWVGRAGPVSWDHLFHGETFDARAQLAGWASLPLSTWPAGTWAPVSVITPPTVGSLLA